ncbi:CRP-like cAMP-binding protein [Rhodoligotrophos appendicifer]|uniref:cyclic nucleotide-binding domain-containing protein n=1 Tax=Rhodoligotrophos appendicifer TaxID=987056 RepID=UPI001180B8C0|nr:cyclic nucleotide-binding domain-containing protein [Rhodoligotrophos appendicifer]
MSVRSRVELLRHIPLFADAADAHLQLLAFAMESIEIETGETLIREGELGQNAFLLEDGTAEITQTKDGEERVIGVAERGACIGELSMVANLPYNVSVTAVTPVRSLRLSRQLFYRVAEEFPDFAEIILGAVTSRVDQSLDELRSVERMFRQARPFTRP